MTEQQRVKEENARMELATSYEAVCKEMGITPRTVDHYGPEGDGDRVTEFGTHKVRTMVKFLNGDWKKDWNNSDPYWWPYFWLRDKEGDTPGSGFRFAVCDYGRGYSHLGARLGLRTRAMAEFMGTKHIDMYREMIKG